MPSGASVDPAVQILEPFMRSSETTPSNIAGSSSSLAAVRQAD
jgi:hypothetical protein